ncbi:MAG: hypothetical protein RIB61_11830 [Roseicyclus sp.]
MQDRTMDTALLALRRLAAAGLARCAGGMWLADGPVRGRNRFIRFRQDQVLPSASKTPDRGSGRSVDDF